MADERADAGGARPLLGPFGQRALRVGRVFGIEVGLDASWILIFLLVTFALGQGYRAEHEGWGTALRWGVAAGASLLFFASILLHELGHSLTSRALGIGVRSITLFVFGGLASLEGRATRPRDELLIAIAGPAVSVLLGVLSIGVALLVPAEGGRAFEVIDAVAMQLGKINLILAVFNCIPAFPLDGGHVLHALVWGATGKDRVATAVSHAAGRAFAMTLMAVGIFMAIGTGNAGGIWPALMGWFLWSVVRGSETRAFLEQRLAGVTVGEAMLAECPCVHAGTTVAELIDGAILHRGERHFYVEEAGRIVGLVTLHEVKRVAPELRSGTTAAEVMVPTAQLVAAEEDESLWSAFRRMDERGINQMPVLRDGLQVGTLTRERVLRVIRNQMEFVGRG